VWRGEKTTSNTFLDTVPVRTSKDEVKTSNETFYQGDREWEVFETFARYQRSRHLLGGAGYRIWARGEDQLRKWNVGITRFCATEGGNKDRIKVRRGEGEKKRGSGDELGEEKEEVLTVKDG